MATQNSALTIAPHGIIPKAIADLPPFSPIAQKVMTWMDDPKVSFKMIADTISMDAALTANVLRLANSALFNCRSQISCVLQALAMLGTARVHDLVLTTAMAMYTRSGRGPAAAKLIKQCWRHNLATAVIAGELAPACDLNRHVAYIGGLLHEIGRLALLQAFAREYSALLETTQADDPALLEKEECEFGCNHRALGGLLAEQWRFSASLRAAMAIREQDADRESDVLGQFDQCDLVGIASQAAEMLGFTSVGIAPAWNVDRVLETLPSTAHRQVAANGDRIWPEVGVRINAAESILSLLS